MVHLTLILVFAVGGIYTVIRSKAPAAVDVLGNKYCLVGIYNDLQCKTEVEIVEPEDPAMKGAIQALKDNGVEVQLNAYLEISACTNSYLTVIVPTEVIMYYTVTDMGCPTCFNV